MTEDRALECLPQVTHRPANCQGHQEWAGQLREIIPSECELPGLSSVPPLLFCLLTFSPPRQRSQQLCPHSLGRVRSRNGVSSPDYARTVVSGATTYVATGSNLAVKWQVRQSPSPATIERRALWAATAIPPLHEAHLAS